ncbi:hypothetical protein [Amycolatopsis japonica]
MNQYDFLQHLVDHARAWGIDDQFQRLTFGGPAPTLRLRDFEIETFTAWAKHLCMPMVSVGLSRTSLVASGQLMSGHRVNVTVRVPSSELDSAGLHGILAVGHLDQLAGTRVTS